MAGPVKTVLQSLFGSAWFVCLREAFAVEKKETAEENENSVRNIQFNQPPPQALRFSHGRGERETRVTGDEPQGAMSPSRLPLRAHFHQKRDVWVRGSNLIQ